MLFAGLAVFLVAAVWSAVFVTSRAVEELLRQDAKSEGEAWARYLAANVKDLGQIVAGERPSAESMAFFEKAEKVGNVFLYKIYAPNGHLRLSSNELDEVNPVAESIVLHNPEAAEAVLAGRTVVEVKNGGGEDGEEESDEGLGDERPAFYSEAYVPVTVEGSVIGIMEAYVDQSEKHAAFDSRIARRRPLARRHHRHCVRPAGARLLLAHAAEAAIGFARRVPRSPRRADGDPEPRALHAATSTRRSRSAARSRSTSSTSTASRKSTTRSGQADGDDILGTWRAASRRSCDKDNLLARLGGDDFALAEIVRAPRQITQDRAADHRRRSARRSA